jgi:hypothetical protein
MNFFRVAAFIGAFFGFYLAMLTPAGWWLTNNWQLITAITLESDIEYSSSSRGGQTHRIRLAYEYEVQGELHTGYRATLQNWVSGFGLEAKKSLLRSEGAPINVWVNPRNPAQSVASRLLIPSEIVFAIGFGMVWFAGLHAIFPLENVDLCNCKLMTWSQGAHNQPPYHLG